MVNNDGQNSNGAQAVDIRPVFVTCIPNYHPCSGRIRLIMSLLCHSYAPPPAESVLGGDTAGACAMHGVALAKSKGGLVVI